MTVATTELCPGIFQEGWIACLKELGTHSHHPAWTTIAPTVKLPDPPAVYSSNLLLGFNEEEYANQSAEEDGVDVGVTHGNELEGGEGERVVRVEGEGVNEGNLKE